MKYHLKGIDKKKLKKERMKPLPLNLMRNRAYENIDRNGFYDECDRTYKNACPNIQSPTYDGT